MNVGEKIKARRKQLKMSVDDLAARLGKNRATIYRYENSEIENMPLEILEPLAKVLRVTPAYLMGWEVEEKTINGEYPFFPTAISAGLPINVEAITNAERISIPDSIMGKHAGSSDIFITRVNGESMNRVIPDESLIAVKPIELSTLKDGDIVVYSDDGSYSVKRYYRDDTRIIFRPDSNDSRFYDYISNIDNENLKIHGKVVLYIVELD